MYFLLSQNIVRIDTQVNGTYISLPTAAASCKPIYTEILRRIICVSKEAKERLPLSNPEGSLMAYPQSYGSLMAAQHFESGDFTFRNRFSRAASQEVAPSQITLNQAGIPTMPLQLLRLKPNLIVYLLVCKSSYHQIVCFMHSYFYVNIQILCNQRIQTCHQLENIDECQTFD
ncbi:Hypothetical_protein [Hexamita inflata]|uniref:Hypothetical_protein n=1 Tax=Hexamita inflata TaxID=28002 RepID=A0ABP1HR13_9EUKA